MKSHHRARVEVLVVMRWLRSAPGLVFSRDVHVVFIRFLTFAELLWGRVIGVEALILSV